MSLEDVGTFHNVTLKLEIIIIIICYKTKSMDCFFTLRTSHDVPVLLVFSTYLDVYNIFCSLVNRFENSIQQMTGEIFTRVTKINRWYICTTQSQFSQAT